MNWAHGLDRDDSGRSRLIQVVIDALEFYAESSNWKAYDGEPCDAFKDHGAIAKAALFALAVDNVWRMAAELWGDNRLAVHEALRFYANTGRWGNIRTTVGTVPGEVMITKGSKAAVVLPLIRIGVR